MCLPIFFSLIATHFGAATCDQPFAVADGLINKVANDDDQNYDQGNEGPFDAMEIQNVVETVERAVGEFVTAIFAAILP